MFQKWLFLREVDSTQRFGEWLFNTINQMSDIRDSVRITTKDSVKLGNAINQLTQLVSNTKKAFVEWQLQNKIPTTLSAKHFDTLLSKLNPGILLNDPKSLVARLNSFNTYLHNGFYPKVINDFNPYDMRAYNQPLG